MFDKCTYQQKDYQWTSWPVTALPLILFCLLLFYFNAVLEQDSGNARLSSKYYKKLSGRSPSAVFDTYLPVPEGWELSSFKALRGHINLEFKGNKNVWGTYDLIKENYSLNERKKVYQKTIKLPGSLTYSKGHTVIIRETQSIQRKAIKILALPIEKMERKKNRLSYTIATDKNRGELFEHFSLELSTLASTILESSLGSISLDRSMVDFEKMSCVREGKAIKCRLPVKILIPDPLRSSRIKDRSPNPAS